MRPLQARSHRVPLVWVKRWLAGASAFSLVPWGALIAALALAHEPLALRARPLAAGEWAYVEALVIAQSAALVLVCAIVASTGRAARFVAAGVAATLPPLVYLDGLVSERTDQHLASIAKLALDASLNGDWRVFAETGIDRRLLPAALAAVGAIAIAGALVDARTSRGPRATRVAHRRIAGAWLGATCALAALEAGAGWAVRSRAWMRVARAMPQPLGALAPSWRARASIVLTPRPRPTREEVDEAIARLATPPLPPPGDVVFLVLESFRADAMNPSLTPALANLVARGLRAETTVAGGNVTHYAWFTLFDSLPPFYWRWSSDDDVARGGATSLRIAERRGWRVEAIASDTFAYNHIDSMLFGAPDRVAAHVANYVEIAPDASGGERDALVVDAVVARLGEPHAPTVFVVSFDATHFGYSWGAGFTPPRAPVASDHFYLRTQDASERRAVRNRYLNAAAYDDTLVARLVAAVRAAGRFDDTTFVVVGDHGEEMWEHGFSTHSSEPCSEQSHVPFAIVPSRAMREADPTADWSSPKTLAGAIDVWPTLLDAAGVRGDLSKLLGGRSLLRAPALPAITGSNRNFRGPARFMLDDGAHKAELVMTDPEHPLAKQPWDVVALRDERDELEDEDATPRETLALLRARFGGAIDRWFVADW